MDTKLIRGKTLYDGEKYLKGEPATLMIAGDRILSVGRDAEDAADQAGSVIDCSGQTLMPGMIDCHNHLSLDPGLPDYLLRMNDPLPELTLRAVHTMEMDLMSGVTTSRCLGDKAFLDVHCQKAQDEVRILGPRLKVATRGIRALHGHGFVGYAFGGPENIRTVVRENLLAGADLIKIYLTGSLRGPKGLPCTFSEAEVQMLVAESHRAGVTVATHCIGGPGLDLALKCGIDVIEHGYFMTPEQIDAMADGPAWLVLTPSIFFTEDRLETLHGNLKELHLKQRGEVGSVMAQVVNSDIRWAIGTDGMHGQLAIEVAHVVGFGANPANAIAGVTTRAAELCGLAQDIGRLEKGKLADIIGVQGDPLQNVSALRQVKTVIQGGRVVKADPSRS
ncbi:MAG: amidohydrolase family protein [Deltaproteobacteria bacterium]|nr:amidohydrolase family protein [Deltaproteobacteria bacterium]